MGVHEGLLAAIPTHPTTNVCDDQECLVCGMRDCPGDEPLHYHHDGCPSCCGPNSVPSRVAAGVEALDRHAPDKWWNRISIRYLDMTHERRSLLGQIFGHRHDVPGVFVGVSQVVAAARGFDPDEDLDGDDVEALTTEWKRVISNRKAGAT